MKSRLLTTSVTTSWAKLPHHACGSVSIRNKTGANLDISTDTGGDRDTNFQTLADGDFIDLRVVGSSSEISIKAGAGASGVDYVVESV